MQKRIIAIVVILSLFAASLYLEHRPIHPPVATIATPVHAQAPDPSDSKEYTAALDVARVFGRSTGCAEADPKFITTVANEAIKANLDPRILAATIAIESACNQFATSTRGAIGLTQIRPSVWKGQYDFEHTYNLLNPRDNIRVGASILGALVKQFGVAGGLRHYNGMGVDCDTCDAGYSDRISALAARR